MTVRFDDTGHVAMITGASGGWDWRPHGHSPGPGLQPALDADASAAASVIPRPGRAEEVAEAVLWLAAGAPPTSPVSPYPTTEAWPPADLAQPHSSTQIRQTRRQK
jgi:hypothetical protein